MSGHTLKGAAVTTRLIVVDTSYLLELFQVPNCSDAQGHEQVRLRFEQACDITHQLHVPLPVLFELGNHIADVKDGQTRRKLANLLVESVQSWLSGETPITIVSALDDARTVGDFCAALNGLAGQFANLVPDRHGLTNTALVMEANRLREKYSDSSLRKYCVHIWTRESRLKALEPDAEVNAFV